MPIVSDPNVRGSPVQSTRNYWSSLVRVRVTWVSEPKQKHKQPVKLLAKLDTFEDTINGLSLPM